MENNGITPELKAEILTDVKLINGITDTSKDLLLTYYIEAICNNILIKTRRKMFPYKLKYVIVDLVNDAFESNTNNSESLKTIQSMSEYDRSVNFGLSDNIKSKLDLIAKKQIESNEKLINEFRLLYRI